MNLCPPCQELYDGWLMTPCRPRKWIQQGPPERSFETKRALHEDHRKLVNHQLDLIIRICRKKHTMTAETPTILAIHRAICEDSIKECLEDYGSCVKAAEAIQPRTINDHHGDEGTESLTNAGSLVIANGISFLLQTDGTWLDVLGSSWDFWELPLPAVVFYEPSEAAAQ